jgi:hypothetical protein
MFHTFCMSFIPFRSLLHFLKTRLFVATGICVCNLIFTFLDSRKKKDWELNVASIPRILLTLHFFVSIIFICCCRSLTTFSSSSCSPCHSPFPLSIEEEKNTKLPTERENDTFVQYGIEMLGCDGAPSHTVVFVGCGRAAGLSGEKVWRPEEPYSSQSPVITRGRIAFINGRIYGRAGESCLLCWPHFPRLQLFARLVITLSSGLETTRKGRGDRLTANCALFKYTVGYEFKSKPNRVRDMPYFSVRHKFSTTLNILSS